MRTRVLFAFLLLISLTLIVTYNSCGITKGFGTLNGTSTGNPDGNDPANTPAIGHLGETSGQILDAICNKLTECHDGAVTSDCHQALLGNLDASSLIVSATSGQILFGSLEEQEVGGFLTASFGAVDTCIGYITKLSCQDPQVLSGYNAANAQPYGGASAIFSEDLSHFCLGIYHRN